MSKLTLSVDDTIIRRAKRYAKARGTSVSRLVEQFLSLVPNERPGDGPSDAAPPILRRLRGSLKGVETDDYLRYLERKYR